MVNRSGSTKRRLNETQHRLRHTRWEYKYHVVFIPKYRKKSIYGWVRKELGPIIRDLAQQKEARTAEDIRVKDSISWPDRFERFTNQASGSAGGK
jgi:putative transposase